MKKKEISYIYKNFAELIFKFIFYNDEEEKKMYLLNAFSLQMVDTPCVCRFSEVEKLPEGLKSAVGHPDTACAWCSNEPYQR